jgi:hypothetical protein
VVPWANRAVASWQKEKKYFKTPTVSQPSLFFSSSTADINSRNAKRNHFVYTSHILISLILCLPSGTGLIFYN